MADSVIVSSHLDDPTQVQDAYSLRCAPQVHGAARDTFGFATHVADVELASAIDNPSVLADGTLASNGNFHGAPVGYALDFLAIAVADVASMSERRTDRMLDVSRSFGLPPFLAGQAGRRLGSDDRAVRAGGVGLGDEAPGDAGERRLDSLLGHAGGPRLDGLARGAQTAASRSTPSPT